MGFLDDIRDPNCTRCRHHQGVDEVCVMGHSFGMMMSPDDPATCQSPIMVVTSRQNSPTFQQLLDGHLKDAGFNTALIHFTSVLKCRNFETSIGKKDIKACLPFLEDEIREVNPEWIIAFGNEALQALTGHSGIMNWRSKVIRANFPSGSRMRRFSF